MLRVLWGRDYPAYPQLTQLLATSWYKTLRVIRETAAHHAEAGQYRLLIDEWRNLGSQAGLDEKIEKRAYDSAKKAAQMCSWVACEWHRAVPLTPTRLCVGCGEARYCSKGCQVK